jgi:hypothetical protein
MSNARGTIKIKMRKILLFALLLFIISIMAIICNYSKKVEFNKTLTLREIPENVVLSIPCNHNMTLRLTGSIPILKIDLLGQDNQILAKTNLSSRYGLPKYAIFNSKTKRQDLLIEVHDGGTGTEFTKWDLFDITSKNLTPLGSLYKNVNDVQYIDGMSTNMESNSTISFDDDGLLQQSITKLTLP